MNNLWRLASINTDYMHKRDIGGCFVVLLCKNYSNYSAHYSRKSKGESPARRPSFLFRQFNLKGIAVYQRDRTASHKYQEGYPQVQVFRYIPSLY